jgi:Glu-tRNA(Gln) amidotransferase subunit E-like FAD-binding protein
VSIEELSDESITETFVLVKKGITAKESIPEILEYLAENPSSSAKQSLEILGLEMLSEEELEYLITQEVKRGLPLIKDRGMKAMGSLMGVVMGKVRGKAEPKKVQKLLQSAIQAELE